VQCGCGERSKMASAEATGKLKGLCAECGVPATKRCGNCRKYGVCVFYCSAEHQKRHWKEHKKSCGARAVAVEQGQDPTATCSRCLQLVGEGGGVCRVEHPVRLREDGHMCFSQEEDRRSYSCSACNGSFMVVTYRTDGRVEYVGDRWCYEGAHTTKVLPEHDERRVRPHCVTLDQWKTGAELQRQIEEVDENVYSITIMGDDYIEDPEGVFDRKFPKLESLKIQVAPLRRIHLTAATCPRLKTLFLDNLLDECELTMAVPTLQNVSLYFWRAEDRPEAVVDMLAAASNLRSFESYKLWSNRHLRFVGPKLEYIRLHRAESLEHLELWAPNLQKLNLQACYDLRRVHFLPTHPLAKKLPANYRCPHRLHINVENANLSPQARHALQHPPGREVIMQGLASDDEQDMGFGMGFGGINHTEQLFSALYAAGFMGGDDDFDDDEDDEDYYDIDTYDDDACEGDH